MKNKKLQTLNAIIFCIMLLIGNVIYSCSGSDANNNKTKSKNNELIANKNLIRVLAPLNGNKYIVGTDINFKIESTENFDSLVFYANSLRLAKLTSRENSYVWKTQKLQVGRYKIAIKAYFHDDYQEEENLSVNLLSDINPKNINYTITSIYPHDKEAYTQGLYYEDGILYESTGQYGQSSLRKVKIQTGEQLNNLKLPDNIFGEGLTVYGNKIIQISWKEQVGFIYNKRNFTLERRISYPISEGWGITYNGTHFYMSDGSNLIYLMDTTYFTELSRFEVFDNEGSVNYLNELEYINGFIFANIYGQDEIVVIDPKTGKVVAKINFKNLLKKSEKQPGIDVFNGIAWNPKTSTLFVTGKNWPKLFEVKLSVEINRQSLVE